MNANGTVGRSRIIACRSIRAVTCASVCSSVSNGMLFSNTARAYASDCNNPGTSRHSYVHRLTASRSSRAHRRNHAASPASPRVRCRAAFRSAPVLPRASSARSTNASSGIRRPNSTDSTVCLEYWTRAASSARLSPACSRSA